MYYIYLFLFKNYFLKFAYTTKSSFILVKRVRRVFHNNNLSLTTGLDFKVLVYFKSIKHIIIKIRCILMYYSLKMHIIWRMFVFGQINYREYEKCQ